MEDLGNGRDGIIMLMPINKLIFSLFDEDFIKIWSKEGQKITNVQYCWF